MQNIKLVLSELRKENKLYISSQKIYKMMNFNAEFQTLIIFNQINIIFHQEIKKIWHYYWLFQ